MGPFIGAHSRAVVLSHASARRDFAEAEAPRRVASVLCYIIVCNTILGFIVLIVVISMNHMEQASQATLLNLLLRNYLAHNLYDQARQLVLTARLEAETMGGRLKPE